MYLVIDYSTSIGIDYYSINSCTKDFLKDLVNKTDDPSLVSSIKLNSNSLVLWPKRLYALKADISPKTAENQTVVWSSSAPSVATVSSSGLVEAVGLGSCTITVTTIDGGYSDSCNVTVSEMPIAEAVDLGLSVKWASFNLGAADSSHYGDKIAWGEVEPKTDYRWSTYKWCNGSASSLTKYNTKSSWGTVDNKTVLDPEDDAATVNWGDNWRTPTYSEMLELRQKCSWDYLMVGEVPCFKVTSKQPGYTNRFIIIPGRGVDIYYASSLLDSGTPWAANYFSMDEDESPFSTTSGPRCMGVYIRPVCDK